MNRLYVAECMPTSTGSRADHRLPLKPSEIEGLARQIDRAIGSGGPAAPKLESVRPSESWSSGSGRWIDAVPRTCSPIADAASSSPGMDSRQRSTPSRTQ
jgi:hypothetical protein